MSQLNYGSMRGQEVSKCAQEEIRPAQGERQPQVLCALKDLSISVDGLEKEYSMISDRLLCVSSLPPPNTIGCDKKQPEMLVELAAIIYAHSEKVNSISLAMRLLRNRLEI